MMDDVVTRIVQLEDRDGVGIRECEGVPESRRFSCCRVDGD